MNMTNPAKTLWWETFELWDALLYRLGGAYYMARPPKASRDSTSSSKRRAVRREKRSMGSW